MPKSVVFLKSLKLIVNHRPIIFIELINIPNLPEFNFKEVGSALGATTNNDMHMSAQGL